MLGKILTRCTMAAALALIGHGLLACGDDGDGGGGGANCSASTLTYANFAQPLFTQNCIACHGAVPIGNQVKLDSLASVKAASEEIIEHAVELEPPAMPYMPAAPLPVETRNNLRTWLECGAPP
jgi:mono/diheme cytochrome c family protein